jgi:hypothetical protein
MRCPKCGYTSFDHLETCKKCNRAIADLVSGIDGTVYNALAPIFLRLTEKMPTQTPSVSGRTWEDEADAVGNETEGAVREGIDTEFFLDDDITTITSEDDDEAVLNLDDFEEVSPRDEFTLDLEGDEDEKELNMPALDFGDLDISDLAPPFEDDLQQPVKEGEPVAALSARQTVPAPPQGAAPAALEDLQYNGLDLDAPARFVSGSAAGKRYAPSVKTGTALDKFDIDLGDLFKKDEK